MMRSKTGTLQTIAGGIVLGTILLCALVAHETFAIKHTKQQEMVMVHH